MTVTTDTAGIQPIAVIGMACRLPGARDVDQFWRNLVAGKESISFRTPEQSRAAGVTEAELSNQDYVAAAPMMPDADMFDAGLFGLTEQEARMCDPQIRVFLELCHAAMENAGYDPFHSADSVGVFGTTGPNGYLRQIVRHRPDLVEGSANVLLFTLNHADYLATLASHRLDLRGPSMTVLTACSSSLVAVHLAAQALRAGDCDTALAGASVVEVPLGQGYVRTPGSVHSTDGHCRPFDATATGTVFGSGAGVVVLKRLDDALAAGDDIRAVIRGSAVNNDGADKVSFSAPSVSGQTGAIVEAMVLAGVRPTDVEYVEAHATGTALGDPIEIRAMTAAYQVLADEPLMTGRTLIGSVKSNIGHMNAAAGIAGLIKTVLMLERGAVVPSINVETPNPNLELERTPFAIATRLRPWPRREDTPRVAAVSSLGVGGTNAHVVLTEGPHPLPRSTDDQLRILPWSTRTEQGTEALRDTLAAYFAARDPADFADAVATLQHGRTEHPVRAAVVSRSSEAAAVLTDPSSVITGRAEEGRTTVFLFPGQGAHRVRMAAGLYGTVRPFTIAMDECVELFEAAGVPLHDLLLAEEPIDDTAAVQPLLFAVEYAMSEMWAEWGARPDAVLGHSLGEIAAATVAGVFDLPDAVRLVAGRAAAMTTHPVPGGLLAVKAGVEEVSAGLPADVSVAAVNGPAQTVLAGPAGALARLARSFASQGTSARMLNDVPYAFHHPAWQAAADEFHEVVESVMARPPRIRFYSGRTGALVTAGQATDPRFWSDQLCSPVLFGSALDAVLADAGSLLLEVGPGATLTGLARRFVATGTPLIASLPSSTDDDQEAVLRAAARLWTHGVGIDWTATGQDPPARKLAVPGYPYQRRRYWIDPEPVPVESTGTEKPAEMDTSRPSQAATPFATVEWVRVPRPADLVEVQGTALVLLPRDGERALDVVSAVERAGYRAVRVRPGAEYAEPPGEFQVRLAEPADLAQVWSRLAERGVELDMVVHAAALEHVEPSSPDGLSRRLDAAFTSLWELARGVARKPVTRFFVITSGSVDVSGDDPVIPARTTAHGVVRTLLAEVPGLLGGVIDLGDRVALADLAAELRLDNPPDAVALRGRKRWMPVETPLHVPETSREVLRERGVYLITGGFGGLGRAIARHLARTGLRPRLVLLGRRAPTGHDAFPDPELAHVREEIAELRALGAEVTPLACDVTDREAVRSVVSEVMATHGMVHGVFHLAGVPGSRMIAFRDHEHATAVLAPKTHGTANILDALAELADFTVLFSSRAAGDGLVGGADYAAANAFLDATAHIARRRVLSVAWPVWLGEGMVDHDGPDITRLAAVVAQLDAGTPPDQSVTWEGDIGAATHWVLDEHRVGREALLPGAGYVDLVVTVFCDKLGEPDKATELTDVVFRAPLVEERTRPVRILFAPAGVGYDFTVSSRVGSTWTDHVTGRIANVAGQAAEVDIAAVRDRLMATAAGVPARKVDVPFTLGPRWRNIQQVWQSGDERLVELELMPAFAGDVREHRLHPALLDMGTAALRDPGEGAFVPFLIRRLTRYADLPTALYSYVRRLPSGSENAVGAVDFVSADGTVIVSVEGYTMRPVDFSDGWNKSAAPPEGKATAGSAGLDPEVGVSLLMRLLGNDTPASVLVRPYVNEQPVPLDSVSPAVTVPTTRRVALPREEPVRAEPVVTEASVPDRMRELWSRTLGAPPASAEADFFEVGGDSLAAVELMAKLRATFGVELSIGLLLDIRTYGGLLDAVQDALA